MDSPFPSIQRFAMTKRNKGISRREFVQSAAVGAVPLILSRSVLGDDKKDAANERLGIGFIGVGTMNRGHLGHFLGQKEVQVLAVCDVDKDRREAAKKTVETKHADAVKSGTYRGCEAYNDSHELLARKDIDAVVIATPDHWHTIVSLEA